MATAKGISEKVRGRRPNTQQWRPLADWGLFGVLLRENQKDGEMKGVKGSIGCSGQVEKKGWEGSVKGLEEMIRGSIHQLMEEGFSLSLSLTPYWFFPPPQFSLCLCVRRLWVPQAGVMDMLFFEQQSWSSQFPGQYLELAVDCLASNKM